MTTHNSNIEEKVEVVPASVESSLGDTDPDSTACIPTTSGTELYIPSTEMHIVDLYAVGSEEHEVLEINPIPEVPFVHSIALIGINGGKVRVRGVFDSGAMVNAMCSSVYSKVKHRLSALRKSKQRLRMADGTIVPSIGRWTGPVTLGKTTVVCSFEVFPSGGSWGFLVGKRMQRLFGAIHDHAVDKVSIPCNGGYEVLVNQIHYKHATDMLAYVGLGPTSDIKQKEIFGGAPIVPAYPVTKEQNIESHSTETPSNEASSTVPEPQDPLGEPVTPWTNIWKVDIQNQPYDPDPGTAQPEIDVEGDTSIFTRKTDPFKETRVDAVVTAVHIGEDLSPEETEIVRDLIKEYADCFALSLGEVHHVPGAVHRINIPEGKTFNTKVQQRPLTPPQRTYYNGVLDQMLEAGVIVPIAADKVKCVSPTTLAQKAHQGGGLTLDEIKHRVNDQCIAAGIPGKFDLPPRPAPEDSYEPPSGPPKWRICQNYGELNKVTAVPPMLQGDIRTKQQKLCGQRWRSVFDFAAGFYAVEIHEDTRPYLAFYDECKGFLTYGRMPFGLTGAPTCFNDMTARELGDLKDSLFQLFVDDGGMAGEEFKQHITDLRKLLDRIRERKLSLSASKTELFMTEAVFAGATVGPDGIKPDLTKLTAIVDWEQPEDLNALESFLGLTGHFRDLIQDYSRIAAPLTDLKRDSKIPNTIGKAAYRRAMRSCKLLGVWTDKHTESFLKLKALLTNEPVLKGPKFDGTTFVVTSDGSGQGFGGSVSQRFATKLPSGKVVTRLHPIGFASKRTSRTEEKYKSFLLEFAALKFCLDKFSDILWGFPIEIETDCQALRDLLLNDKLPSAHARWRDGILAHHIVDVRHIKGKNNPVGDGMSRKWAPGSERTTADGSTWSVNPDWEERTGLLHDIFVVTNAADDTDITDPLVTRFAAEPLFQQVVLAIRDKDHALALRDRKRARHRASEYQIDGGKLWHVRGKKSVRARARKECVTQGEALIMAREIHGREGHFGRDAIKEKLVDKIKSPYLDQTILTAIRECGRCKGFGNTHLHSLLEPITRRHPGELLVGDYCSISKGKGGFNNLGVYLDVFSRHTTVYTYKKSGTGLTTVNALRDIGNRFIDPEAVMVDGGSHFNNKEVKEFCKERGIKLHIVAKYSPWVNGLVEGTNKILLGILKRLCAPDLGEDEYELITDFTDLPKNWPDHLDEAVRQLNRRILPSLKFSPNELAFGSVVNTNRTDPDIAATEPTVEEVNLHMAYVEQQNLDGQAQTVLHANNRKAVFDRNVVKKHPKEIIFKRGELVQVYRSELTFTHSTTRKLAPQWSPPFRITSRIRNAYKLETLNGSPAKGEYSARRLRRFHAREGTQLAADQERHMAKRKADR